MANFSSSNQLSVSIKSSGEEIVLLPMLIFPGEFLLSFTLKIYPNLNKKKLLFSIFNEKEIEEWK